MGTNKRKILAFIPARSGSKGLPGKNIIKVAGLPLIAYSINSGRSAKLVDKILVSTDSPQGGEALWRDRPLFASGQTSY